MVEKFGTLVEFDFLYHRSGPQQGQPRGYAFITYAKIESTNKAQRTLDGVEVFGRKLSVKWAHAQDEDKYMAKVKLTPPILSISGKECVSTNSKKKMSKEGKIAALEAELRMLEEKKIDPAIAPDIGGPSKPTKIFYKHIENKSNSTTGKAQSTSRYNSQKPYYKRNKFK